MEEKAISFTFPGIPRGCGSEPTRFLNAAFWRRAELKGDAEGMVPHQPEEETGPLVFCLVPTW